METNLTYTQNFLQSTHDKARQDISRVFNKALEAIKTIDNYVKTQTRSTLTFTDIYNAVLRQNADGESPLDQILNIVNIFRELKEATVYKPSGVEGTKAQIIEQRANLFKEAVKKTDNEKIAQALEDNSRLDAKALGNISETVFTELLNIVREDPLMLDTIKQSIIEKVQQIANPAQYKRAADAVVQFTNGFNFGISFKTGLRQDVNGNWVDAFTVSRQGNFYTFVERGITNSNEILNIIEKGDLLQPQEINNLKTAIAWFYILSGLLGREINEINEITPESINFQTMDKKGGMFPLFLMSQNHMIPITNMLQQLYDMSDDTMYKSIHPGFSKFPFAIQSRMEYIQNKRQELIDAWGQTIDVIQNNISGALDNNFDDVKDLIRLVYPNVSDRDIYKANKKNFNQEAIRNNIEQLIQDLLDILSNQELSLEKLSKSFDKDRLNFTISYSIAINNDLVLRESL